jgi:curved DNA-binding protein CbpA
VIDPYDMLGIARDADNEQIRSAYRTCAKTAHPDSGGDEEAFIRIQKAGELLLDPIRRKVFDATGYDPELADAKDLQGLMVIEKLVNDIVLDEREAGTFDPVAGMRAKLEDEIHKARFHMREMEGHGQRIRDHIERLAKRPESDVLGYMLRARVQAISGAVAETAGRIEAAQRAMAMLDGYAYEVDLEDETLEDKVDSRRRL